MTHCNVSESKRFFFKKSTKKLLPDEGLWVKRRPFAGFGGKAAIILLFLPPALLLFTVFVAVPMGEAAWYSFFNWNGYRTPTQFVGWRNYDLLFANRAFKIALTNNALIIAVSLLVQLPLALAMATLLADRLRGTNVFRLIFFLPYVLAEIAAGLIWRFVYDGEYGLLAKAWEAFGAVPPHVQADAGIAARSVPVTPVPLQLADRRRNLGQRGLDLLKADDVRPLLLHELHELLLSGTNPVHVPGSDFHPRDSSCL